ncbi:MAG: immunity 26/phosphotriesterase HocA family protein [Lachnospiraceae bacterium]|nr:immunity 26/phosphotriesterase HocA family protein [Lachnospiraceae bacterium]
MTKIWGWDKKPRTMLRYIKLGDIFCFQYDDFTYCFGQIIAKVTFYIAKIYAYTSDKPIISEDIIHNGSRLTELVVLDAYSLFDRKTEGEWRIIGHQENYTTSDAEGIYFAWGIGSGCRKSDIFNNTIDISEEEWKVLPKLAPHGDYNVKSHIVDDIYGKHMSDQELGLFMDYMKHYDTYVWEHRYIWIKAFLYAKYNKMEQAEKVIKDYFRTNEESRKKVIEELRKINANLWKA